jgi:hypothetical protein
VQFWRNLDWSNWLYGMWVAVVHGGANAVVGGFSIFIQDPSHFNMQRSAFYEVVLTIWGVSSTLGFFLYLSQHPAPDKIVSKETTTFVKTVEKTETPIQK